MEFMTPVIVIAATIAIINRLKAEIDVPPNMGWIWTIVAFLVGPALYSIGLASSGGFSVEVIPTLLFIGLASAGIFDVYSGKGK
jgi:hypothetical protein